MKEAMPAAMKDFIKKQGAQFTDSWNRQGELVLVKGI
jgi:hypothetical protein